MNDDMTTSQIRSIQTLGSVAIIASPVSLVFGGMLLSTVALICALVGRSKLKVLSVAEGVSAEIVQTLRRQNKVALIVSITALIINAVFFAFTFNMLMQMMQSGDYTQLSQMFGLDPNAANDAANGDAAADISVWDK